MISIRLLHWDEFNKCHITRHGVTVMEVVEVCYGYPVDLESYRRRVVLVGPTRSGRVLAVVLSPMGNGVYYPVSAREASAREMRFYQGQKEPDQR